MILILKPLFYFFILIPVLAQGSKTAKPPNKNPLSEVKPQHELLARANKAFEQKEYLKAVGLFQRLIIFEKQMRLAKKGKSFHIEDVFSLYNQAVFFLKNPRLKIKAYDFYLEQSLQRRFIFEVRYFKNKALFELSEWEISAPVFRQIALYGRGAFAESSAFLALKALMNLNQGASAQKWAVEFSALFPKHERTFKDIVQKALIKQMVASIHSIETLGVPSRPSHSPDLKEAFLASSRIDMPDILAQNRSSYCFYASLLTVELHRFQDFEKISSHCLKILSEKNKDWLHRKRMQVFESVYDFKKAYHEARKVYGQNQNPYHLCLLSVLASSPDPACRGVVNQNKGSSFLFLESLAYQKVDDEKFILPYVKLISQKSTALFSFYFKTGAWRKPHPKIAEALNRYPQSLASQFEKRKSVIMAMDHSFKRAQKTALSPQSRLQYLIQMEEWIKKQNPDFSLQAIALFALQREHTLFFDGLSAQKSFSPLRIFKKEYKQIAAIKKKVKIKIHQLKKQKQRLWAEKQNAFQYLTALPHAAFQWEKRRLIEASPRAYQKKLKRLFPTQKTESKFLWAALKQNPFRLELLKNKNVQLQRGVVPAYLKAREKLQEKQGRFLFPVEVTRQ